MMQVRWKIRRTRARPQRAPPAAEMRRCGRGLAPSTYLGILYHTVLYATSTVVVIQCLQATPNCPRHLTVLHSASSEARLQWLLQQTGSTAQASTKPSRPPLAPKTDRPSRHATFSPPPPPLLLHLHKSVLDVYSSIASSPSHNPTGKKTKPL